MLKAPYYRTSTRHGDIFVKMSLLLQICYMVLG